MWFLRWYQKGQLIFGMCWVKRDNTISLQFVIFTANSMAYGKRRFNGAFAKALQESPSGAESTQFLILIPISLRSILILFSHLRLGLPKDLFSVHIPVKSLKVLLSSSILATWPAHLNLLDLITLSILGEWYKLRTSSM
jgi:hypothetical protein